MCYIENCGLQLGALPLMSVVLMLLCETPEIVLLKIHKIRLATFSPEVTLDTGNYFVADPQDPLCEKEKRD